MTKLTIGSVFSGIGAMDLACERHFKARTAWFCEREAYPVQVLGKRWPGLPVYSDVTTLADEGAAPVDILIGGPPCVDLSCAGRQEGLTGQRSGLFFDFVAVAARMRPQPRWVVIENVPALLSGYRGVVEAELAAAGYGVTWAKVAAAHVAGCPHLRKRVFVLAELGGSHRGVCDAGPVPSVPDAAMWPTPVAGDTGRSVAAWDAATAASLRVGTPGLKVAVEKQAGKASRWPTPSGLAGGQRSRGGARIGELLLAGAVTPARWATPATRDYKDGAHDPGMSIDTLPRQAVAPTGTDPNRGRDRGLRWPTPAAFDAVTVDTPARRARIAALSMTGKPQRRQDGGEYQTNLNDAVSAELPPVDMSVKGRLSPAWVEVLQGLPPGWSDVDCDKDLSWYAQHLMTMPRWPAPMVRGMWGDSPQHRFEPPRTVTGKQPHRSARLKALGNCLPPQQYLLALELLAQGPKQRSLFDLMDG